MHNPPTAFTLVLLAIGACSGMLRAERITVPNGSFESPPTPYATPLVDAWQQNPPVNLGDPNTFQTGVFSNQPPADPTHIDNCDGSQGAFLFTYPQVALFQDYDSTDYANPTPTHAFAATFDVGKSYTLTVGVIGGTNLAYPMQEGTTLELSLYYRDDAGNKTNVAATIITNSGALFPSSTHFVDFQVHVPAVLAADPWAGRHIGVQLLSTVGYELMGGYWDLDNVRLIAGPCLLAPARTNSQFTFILHSYPGLRFEILATTNLTLPVSNWSSLGNLTNTTGATPFLDLGASLNRRFYRARQLL
jgi:hypothetical protein